MNPLLTAAQRAFDETEFYSRVYETRPTDPAHIPFITHADYHQAAGLLDCITDRSQVSGSLPAFHRNVRKFPFNIVESETEQQQRHQRLMHGLSSLGITSTEPAKFLVIADDASGPFAGELATCLAWEHHLASITFHHGDPPQLRDDVECYSPDFIIKVSTSSWHLDPGECRNPPVTVHHVDHPIPGHDNLLLACDEIGVFAARRTPADPFMFDPENLQIETRPRTGLAGLTTLNFGIAPFIRYCPSQFKISFDA